MPQEFLVVHFLICCQSAQLIQVQQRVLAKLAGFVQNLEIYFQLFELAILHDSLLLQCAIAPANYRVERDVYHQNTSKSRQQNPPQPSRPVAAEIWHQGARQNSAERLTQERAGAANTGRARDIRAGLLHERENLQRNWNASDLLY